GPHAITHDEHVAHWDAFGNADHQIQIGLNGFPNGVSRPSWGHIDDRNRGASGVFSVLYRSIDWDPFEVLTCLLGMNTRHERFATVGVFAAHTSMELSRFAGNPLCDDLGVFIDENRHL